MFVIVKVMQEKQEYFYWALPDELLLVQGCIGLLSCFSLEEAADHYKRIKVVADLTKTVRIATSSSKNHFHFLSVTINSVDIFKVHFVINCDTFGPGYSQDTAITISKNKAFMIAKCFRS